MSVEMLYDDKGNPTGGVYRPDFPQPKIKSKTAPKEADKELREQLNVLIYEVTDSDDVVKQLADLLIPALIAWRDRAVVVARIEEVANIHHKYGSEYMNWNGKKYIYRGLLKW